MLAHLYSHRGKYVSLAGALAMLGQFALHEWEQSFDNWFWNGYVHAIAERCPR